MSDTINIKTSELAVAKNSGIIKTGSVGSCVVISIYDRENKVGGLAHAMLPTRKHKSDNDEEAEEIDYEPGNKSSKYADESVDNLVKGMKKKGANLDNMVAKLVGGASMFKKLTGNSHNIGMKNIESARTRLDELGIKIENEDTGGSSGKLVELHLVNGVLEVNTKL
jgi:chemotaxis protein CheD